MHLLRGASVMARPYDYVSRVKALMLAGMNAKSVSSLTGIPVDTLHAWRRGRSYSYVEPDPTIHDSLKNLVNVPRGTC